MFHLRGRKAIVSSALLALLLTDKYLLAEAVPAACAAATVNVALAASAKNMALAEIASSEVASLTEAVIRMMTWAKIKMPTANRNANGFFIALHLPAHRFHIN